MPLVIVLKYDELLEQIFSLQRLVLGNKAQNESGIGNHLRDKTALDYSSQ